MYVIDTDKLSKRKKNELRKPIKSDEISYI